MEYRPGSRGPDWFRNIRTTRSQSFGKGFSTSTFRHVLGGCTKTSQGTRNVNIHIPTPPHTIQQETSYGVASNMCASTRNVNIPTPPHPTQPARWKSGKPPPSIYCMKRDLVRQDRSKKTYRFFKRWPWRHSQRGYPQSAPLLPMGFHKKP